MRWMTLLLALTLTACEEPEECPTITACEGLSPDALPWCLYFYDLGVADAVHGRDHDVGDADPLARLPYYQAREHVEGGYTCMSWDGGAPALRMP